MLTSVSSAATRSLFAAYILATVGCVGMPQGRSVSDIIKSQQALQAKQAEVLKEAAKKPLSSHEAYIEMFAQRVNPDSVLRNGTVLNFQIEKLPTSSPSLPNSMQISASCSAPEFEALYFDRSSNRREYLSAGQGNYGPAWPLPAIYYPSLLHNPGFISACSQTPLPDWRLIKALDDGRWALIDTRSVQPRGAETTFWAAIDNPLITFNSLTSAPQSQKREHLAVDCNVHQYRRLARYDLSPQERVSDGEVYDPPERRPMAGSGEEYEAIFKAACDKPQALALLQPYQPRRKQADTIKALAIVPSVLEQARTLKLPPATKALHHLVTVNQQEIKGATVPLDEDMRVSTDPASGLMLISQHSDLADSTELSVGNLVSLSSKRIFLVSTFESEVLTNLSFAGDWEHMPVGAKLEVMSAVDLASSKNAKTKGPAVNSVCTVDRDALANEVNKALSGPAKVLSCRTERNKVTSVYQVFYLMDYGFFFMTRAERDGQLYQTLRMTSFE